MKKMFKRIVTLVLAATLFIMPASTALAASQAVCIYNSPGVLMFQYQPSPYQLTGPNKTFLLNTTEANGTVLIPAGKAFEITVNLSSTASYYLEVTQYDPYAGVIGTAVGTGSTTITFPAQSISKRYLVSITAIGGTLDIHSYYYRYY